MSHPLITLASLWGRLKSVERELHELDSSPHGAEGTSRIEELRDKWDEVYEEFVVAACELGKATNHSAPSLAYSVRRKGTNEHPTWMSRAIADARTAAAMNDDLEVITIILEKYHETETVPGPSVEG